MMTIKTPGRKYEVNTADDATDNIRILIELLI